MAKQSRSAASVARRAAEADHRVVFLRLVGGAGEEVGVLVGLEVAHAHDDRVRREGRRDGADALGEARDVELPRDLIAGDALGDLSPAGPHRGSCRSPAAPGVDADVIVDDELEPRQADAVVGQAAEGQGAPGIADVHHDLDAARSGI
jgi:hypothetical protein